MKKRILSILLAALMLLSVLPAYALADNEPLTTDAAEATPVTDSGITATKSAEWVDEGKDGIAEVTIKVQGKAPEETVLTTPTDIVLVIDYSSGMGKDSKLVNAKKAATRFAETMLNGSSSNVRIAVVPFIEHVHDDTNFSSNLGSVKTAIQKIKAAHYVSTKAGTNIQEGLHVARQKLKQSTAKNKIIIVLTDGAPNRAYDNYATGSKKVGFLTIDTFDPTTSISKEEADKYNIGTDYRTLYAEKDFKYNSSSVDESHLGHKEDRIQKKTVSEALFAKRDGYDVYAIGFGIDKDGRKVLQSVASKGMYYDSGISETEITGVFNKIAQNVKNYCAYDPKVTDVIGTDFEYYTDDTHKPTEGANISVSNNTLTWNVGDHLDEKEQTLTFYVKYKNVDSPANPSANDGKLDTNNEAKLTYKTEKEGTEEKTLNIDLENSKVDNLAKTITYNLTSTENPSNVGTVPGNAYVWPGKDYKVADKQTTTEKTKNGVTGSWQFDGWKQGNEVKTEIENVTEDITLTGSWSFTPYEWNIVYQWATGTPSGAGNPPTDTTLYENEAAAKAAATKEPTEKVFRDGHDTWRFDKWDDGTVKGTTLTYTGTWTSSHDNTYNVKYEYATQNLPKAVTDTRPATTTAYDKDEVHPAQPSKTEVLVEGGKWKFEDWDAASKTVNGADVTFTGTWTFEAAEEQKYKVSYVYVDKNGNTITDTDVIATKPTDNREFADAASVTPLNPTSNEVTVTGGKWTFVKWDENSKTVSGANVTFTGTWEFTESQETTYDVRLTISKTVKNVHGTAPDEDYKFVVYYKDAAGNPVYLRDKDHPLTISLAAGEDSKEKDFTIEMTQTQLNNWPETLVTEGIYEGRVRFVYVEEIDGGTDHMTYAKAPVRGQFVGIAISSMRSVTKYFLYSEPNWQGIFEFTNVYDKRSETTDRDVTPAKVSPQLNRDDHVAYIMGYPDGNVRPEGEITRAEACTIFFRLLTKESRDYYFSRTNDYTDVSRTDWFNNAISTLSNAGIVTGYADGTFRPDQPITRGEMAKIIANFARLGGATKSFTDLSGHWAKSYVELAAGNGWIAGYPDGTFGPDRKITRAETVTMINRVLERVPAKESRLLSRSIMLTFPDNEPGEWYYIAVQEASNSHTYQRSAYETAGDEMWLRLIENVDWTKLEK